MKTNVTFFIYHKGKYWRTDGISNVSYKSEERLITFSLDTFGPVTLIQDTHINMPYQSWELRPLDVNKVLLTVTTVFTEIKIQIKVSYKSHIKEVCLFDRYNSVSKQSITVGVYITMSFIHF